MEAMKTAAIEIAIPTLVEGEPFEFQRLGLRGGRSQYGEGVAMCSFDGIRLTTD